MGTIRARMEAMRALLGPQPDLVQQIDLASDSPRPRKYTRGNAYAIEYTSGSLPSSHQMQADLERMMGLLSQLPGTVDGLDRHWAESDPSTGASERGVASEADDGDGTLLDVDPSDDGGEASPLTLPSPGTFPVPSLPADWDWDDAMRQLIDYIRSAGFYFEPWQIATFVTALRTKPFVILAGISGTGKTRLPRLVAEACGMVHNTVPVRPDWTDSSDLLGYTDLSGQFRPGILLEMAASAEAEPARNHIAVLDEMNLARVEHYFAEVLSRIEERRIAGGQWISDPLLMSVGDDGDSSGVAWRNVSLVPNLAIVGTVNMDESSHGFSRKVLDRAFTLELSDIDLSNWQIDAADHVEPNPWPAAAMMPWATSLAGLGAVKDDDRETIEQVIHALEELNQSLRIAQLQVGYRVRDEVALFVLNGRDVQDSFVTAGGGPVSPLDLAITMKVLPRIMGGSGVIRNVLCGVLGWATGGIAIDEGQADALVDEWHSAGRPPALEGYAYPRSAARICLMWERLQEDGFTSYWL